MTQRHRPTLKCGKGLTKQSFKDECDINHIMAKYLKSGSVEHQNLATPNYGYAAAIDFRESMQIVTEAQHAFDGLPSEVRAEFSNDAARYLDYLDSTDRAELIERGFAAAEPPIEQNQEKKETELEKTVT